MNPGYPPYPNQQQMPGQQSGPPYGVYPPQNPQSSYPNQPGFGSGYQPGYPPTSGYPPAPQPGYPPQSAQPGYPVQSAYPPAPSSMPYPQSSYPPMPSSQPSTGFSYPQSTPSAYPPQSTPSAYPSQPAYNQSQPAYPQNAAAPGYPSQQAYSNCVPNANYPTQQLGSHQGQITSSHFSNLSASNTCSPHAQPNYGKNNAYTQIERPTPTVVPAASFNARSDAEILRKAMKGLGTDEKAIINVLTKRSNSQRLEIANQFKALYGKDLINDLKSELTGKFEDLILALMTPLPEFLAKEVQHAIEGIGTNDETLVEILCTASNAQIYAIKDAYQRVFYRSMENDLSGDTSGHFKRLLISVLQGRRAENVQVDEAAVAKDARDLLAAGKLQIGTDESTFNAILVTRSYPHLRRVITEYQRLSGHTLEKAIKDEFSGDIKTGLLAIVRSVESKADFFAERLRDSVACIGTKDRQLIRIVVSRCEIDMQEIKRAYQARYQKSLEQAISDDVSGDYKKALLSLIGGY